MSNDVKKVSEKELVQEIMRVMSDGKGRSVKQMVDHTGEDQRRIAITLGRLDNFGLLDKEEVACKTCGTPHVWYRLPKSNGKE